MVDPMITGLGVVALMGAAATIAGAAEDLESDVFRSLLNVGHIWDQPSFIRDESSL